MRRALAALDDGAGDVGRCDDVHELTQGLIHGPNALESFVELKGDLQRFGVFFPGNFGHSS